MLAADRHDHEEVPVEADRPRELAHLLVEHRAQREDQRPEGREQQLVPAPENPVF